jgi:hypothetical protein
VAAHDLYVGPITYLRYHEAPPFTNDMEPLMHKRHGFAAEQELRILRFDEVHFKKLVPKDASIPELREHIYLEWRLADVIEKIIISPYADESYEGLVRHTISTADASLADRIELSELHERRYAPEF